MLFWESEISGTIHMNDGISYHIIERETIQHTYAKYTEHII